LLVTVLLRQECVGFGCTVQMLIHMETVVAHLEYACLGVLHSIQDRINVCILFRTRQAFPSTCSSCKLTSLDVSGQPG
jgi:hypothetical protein